MSVNSVPILHHNNINNIFNANDFTKIVLHNIVPVSHNGTVNSIINTNDFINSKQKTTVKLKNGVINTFFNVSDFK